MDPPGHHHHRLRTVLRDEERMMDPPTTAWATSAPRKRRSPDGAPDGPARAGAIGPGKSLGLLTLFVLSAIVVLGYNSILSDIPRDVSRRDVAASQNWYEFANPMDERRRLDVDAYMKKRMIEVMRDTWPECVNQRMKAVQCKEFIDEEILSTFTEWDVYIRVIIKGKRKPVDEWYNTVVITMSDDDMAVGIGGDGQIEYDFTWESSGEVSTPEQQSEIPPILATETEAGSPQTEPLGDPLVTPTTSPDYVPEANPEEEVYEPLILEVEPVLVVGTTVEGALLNDTKPIAGGVVIDPETPNTPEGDVKLQAAIDEYLAPPTLAPTASAPTPDGGTGGAVYESRELPAFDCDGLTGYNCCLMIKLKVPDSDVNDRAIQCQLIYEEGSNKERFWLNARGKKVFIWANHNEFVNKIPQIVGDWPKGKTDEEFAAWLADGGGDGYGTPQ